MAVTRYNMSATTLEGPTVGVWCPVCLLPSGYTATVALEINGTPHQLLTLGRCVDCGVLL